jgi:hypothetical protein
MLEPQLHCCVLPELMHFVCSREQACCGSPLMEHGQIRYVKQWTDGGHLGASLGRF